MTKAITANQAAIPGGLDRGPLDKPARLADVGRRPGHQVSGPLSIVEPKAELLQPVQKLVAQVPLHAAIHVGREQGLDVPERSPKETDGEYRHSRKEHPTPDAAGQGLINRLPHQRRDGESGGRRGEVHHEGPTKEPRVTEAVFGYAPEDSHIYREAVQPIRPAGRGTGWGEDERSSLGVEVGRVKERLTAHGGGGGVQADGMIKKLP